MDYTKQIKQYIDEELDVIKKLDVNVINLIMNELEQSRLRGSTVFICGNGGSASTASHYACDFNKGVSGLKDKNSNFVCLSDNIPTMMAIANDISFDEMLKQLKYLFKKHKLIKGEKND